MAPAQYSSSWEIALVASDFPHILPFILQNWWQTPYKWSTVIQNCHQLHQSHKCLLSSSLFCLLSSSPSWAYPARLSSPAITVRAASLVSRAAIRTWAQRMNLPMMSTARLRSARSAVVPCSALTGGTATVDSMERGTAQWIATGWCHSSALGLVDAFCLRWK